MCIVCVLLDKKMIDVKEGKEALWALYKRTDYGDDKEEIKHAERLLAKLNAVDTGV